jgi:hypothetical protein
MPATTLRTGYDIMNTKSSNLNCSIAAEYNYCDLCALNGCPNQKVIYQFEGFRAEEEEGFIYKFSIYDYPIEKEKRINHKHKCNKRFIDAIVNVALQKWG